MYADTRKRLDPDSSPLAKVMGKPLAAHLAAKVGRAPGSVVAAYV